jgi:predicted metalloendopeptidase
VAAAYHTVLASVFNATLPSPAARAVSSQIADEIIAMEKKLVAIIPPLEDQRNVQLYYTPSNLTATAALAPALGLDIYFKAMAPANYSFDYMITAFPDYLRKTNDILLSTPKRALQAYFIWNLVSTSKSLVIAPEVEVINRFSRILNGQVGLPTSGRMARWSERRLTRAPS